MSVVYGLADPKTFEIRYIGKTERTLEERLKEHLYSGEQHLSNHKYNWIKSLSEPPKIVPLETNPININESEKYWIAKYREMGANLTNYLDGGEGWPKGQKQPQEMVDKRVAKIKGHKWTEEAKARFSAQKKGTLPSQATREAVSKAKIGTKQSPDTRAKMSASQTERYLNMTPEQNQERIRKIKESKEAPKRCKEVT